MIRNDASTKRTVGEAGTALPAEGGRGRSPSSDKLKVCLIGATAVGKTSLVRRYVSSVFSDVYRTTIGVKIETRQVRCGERAVSLVIWDLNGQDDFQSVRPAYLQGTSGYLLVIDGTRPETVETAVGLQATAREVAGDVPFVALINKSDLVASWELRTADLQALRDRGWPLLLTSARTGEGVEETFDQLARAMMAGTG